jgi:23S rRNA A1618 N6-methylase RlmF
MPRIKHVHRFMALGYQHKRHIAICECGAKASVPSLSEYVRVFPRSEMWLITTMLGAASADAPGAGSPSPESEHD